MKKSLTYGIAAAMALTAVTPAVVANAEAEQPAAGFYNLTDGEESFTSMEAFLALSGPDKGQLLFNENVYYVSATGDAINTLTLASTSNDDIPNILDTIENVEATTGKNFKQIEQDFDVEAPSKLAVDSVSAINKTVTLNVASFDYDAEDEDVDANVAFFALDEDGEVAEDATADLEADYDIEDGKVEVDVKSLADGDYKVVVTIGEEEQEATATIDFEAADELLDKIVNAANAAKLAPLLDNEEVFEDYDVANIDA